MAKSCSLSPGILSYQCLALWSSELNMKWTMMLACHVGESTEGNTRLNRFRTREIPKALHET